jgi:hypothetical protein
MSNLSTLPDKIAQLQNNYYAMNQKKTFFASSQKNDCATTISKHLGINELICHTIYNIPNTNKIFFDYTIFKTYATEPIFETIVDRLMQTTEACIQTYGSFEMHVNWNTYSVSAHERYKKIYQMFTTSCTFSRFNFSDKLIKMHVYNVPAMIDTLTPIIRPFVDPKIIDKICLYTKKDSEYLLAQLSSR